MRKTVTQRAADRLAALRSWRGDCYEAATRLILEAGPRCDLRVCQGEPMGQGPIAGIRHGHAWVERRGLVWDLCHSPNPLPAPLYYAIGRIEAERVRRYTHSDVLYALRTEGHYGPWGCGLKPKA